MTGSLFIQGAPDDTQYGSLQPFVTASGNVWVIQFGPYSTKRQIKRIAIDPPSDATGATMFKIYKESTRIATSPQGNATNWSPRLPVPLPAGTSLFLVWFIGTGTKPEALLMSDSELV